MPAAVVQRFSVPFEYPVYFSEDLFAPASGDLVEALASKEPSRRHRLIAVVDRGVADAWPELSTRMEAYAKAHAARMELVAPPIVVGGGEASKNDPQAISALHRALDAHAIDRQSFVLAVGGGAVLDMVGYAAATAHRGVRIVRVPTTVLAQADSGVGVKNGVNHLGKKNFLGTFAPPFAVLIDTRFLSTLSARDAIAGMAEAVKVSLVRDAGFFAWIRENVRALAAREPSAVATLVKRCAELHLAHIATSGDPFELGSARPLDFGHWAAHKLEALTEHRLRHGEAVAIGMAIDSLYAASTGVSTESDAHAVVETLRALGLPTWDEGLELADANGRLRVLAGLAEFREHLGGELTVTLVKTPGSPTEVHEMDEARILAAIARLRRERAAP